MYTLSIDKLIWRFYFMMLAVVIPFYLGVEILALLALPILLSAMFGLDFKQIKWKKSAKPKERETVISALAE